MAYSIHALKKEKVLHSKYEIDTILGEGSFGITYKALDQDLNRWVAIKEYLPINHGAVRSEDGTNVSLSSDNNRDIFEWGLKSFRQEAQTLANIKHDNIIKVLDYFEENGTGYFVMRYEEGETLGKLIKRKKEFNEKEIRQILEPLMDGLQEAHKSGILHRDIKPDNIYLRANGKPMLIDFGAAREAVSEKSKSIIQMLTPPYAPAEQYGTDRTKQGAWTDIYALGMVAYRLITEEDSKQIPIATDRQNTLLNNESDPLPKLRDSTYKRSYSGELLESIDKALAINRKDRFQAIKEWQEVLREETLTDKEAKKESKPVIQKEKERATPADSKSKKGVWIGAMAIMMVILLGVGGYLWQQHEVIKKIEEEKEKLANELRIANLKIAEMKKEIGEKDKKIEELTKEIEEEKEKLAVYKDPKTGLMWQKERYTKKEVEAYDNDNNYGKAGNWQYAKNYCARLNYAGYSDWRLPNLKELKTIFTNTKRKSSNGHSYYIVKQLLNNMPPHSKGYANYWSSTSSARSSDDAWIIFFFYGSDLYNNKSDSLFVRCVR